MIMHIMTFSWREGATDKQLAELTDPLGTLVPLEPQLRTYQHGRALQIEVPEAPSLHGVEVA